MAVPKHKVSKSRTNSRFANWTIKKVNLVECSNCHELKRPHQVCPKCGYYDGKPVKVVNNND
ncbi:MAG: 50S ribosomal protein L32 [Clostridia bacterium]|nr:50S ribosomal protein L32 [Clostridia bacterium]